MSPNDTKHREETPMDILVSEVGPRDGLQSIRRPMPTEAKIRWIWALAAAGLRMEEVPYRGSAPAAQDLVAGRVEMLYDAGVTGFPLATSGQARALAVSSAQRSAVMPDVPTVAEAGFPAATFSVWQGVLAPSGTPASILEKVRQEIAAVLAEGALRARLTELGAERIVVNTPAEARAYVDAEMARWERVLREAGVRPQ